MSTRTKRINIDLGPYKQPWITYCRARGSTPSAMTRLLVAPLLQAAGEGAAAAQAGRHARSLRKQVSLTPAELEYVGAAARKAGLSDVRWIAALVRAHMNDQPQLGQAEMAVLGRSNLALLAIGRNLNQLVRAAHASGTLAPAELVEVLVALRVQLSSHVDSVAQLLSANQPRGRTS